MLGKKLLTGDVPDQTGIEMSTCNSTKIIRDFRDLHIITKELGSAPQNVSDAELPSKPAVYCLFAKDNHCLPDLRIRTCDFLYVGKSEHLVNRGHFRSGQTSRSTLRRTLGALLKQDLNLRAYSRGHGCNARDHNNYRFNNAGEERLNEWMNDNLTIGFSAVINDINEIERRLIRFCEPILNLKLWDNPNREKIKALRKICAEVARRNGPLRDN